MRLFFIAGSLLLTSVFNSVAAEAQDDVANYNLEAVSITAGRIPSTLANSARIVRVITKEELSSYPAKTVNDLLKYTASLDIRQRGTMGVQTDLSMRGGTFDQVAVLLNGINISDPQTGHNALDLPVNVADIERIEVLEGGASRVYGTSSLVGAVNIVTKSNPKELVSGTLEFGSYGSFDARAGVNLSKNDFSSHLSADYSRSDGYSRSKNGKLNSDYNIFRTFYNGGYKTKQADYQWYAGLSSKGYGANTFYSASFDEQYEKTLKTFTAVQAETKGFFHFKPSAYWNYGEDRFELVRGDESRFSFNYHKTNVFGLNIGNWFETSLGKTAFGAEMRVEEIRSNALGESLNKEVPIKGTDKKYKFGVSRTNILGYLEHKVSVGGFNASAGVVAVKNTGDEGGFGFYPGIDLSYSFMRYLKLYASYNSSFRMPTFTELYYSRKGYVADKYLKPEKMHTFSGGLRYTRPGINSVLTIYYHRGANTIDWLKDVTLGEDGLWMSVNHTMLNTFGQEFALDFDFHTLFENKDLFFKNLHLSYSHIDQDKKLPENMQSRYALEYLKHNFVASLNMKVYKKLFYNVSYRYSDRNGSYEVFENGKTTNTLTPYKPYHLVDMKLFWSSRNYNIFVEANNVLNRRYFDYGNIPQPGLWLRAGITYNIYN